MKVLLVTGGAGFIGGHFVRYFLRRNKNFIIVNIDKLNHAGGLENLKEIEDSPRHHFIKGDICNYELIHYVLKRYRPEYIINFAAEFHAVRNMGNPNSYAQTNIMGTLSLLEGARSLWSRGNLNGTRFIQVSTDEVYGNTEQKKEYIAEEASLIPGNPYSASRAGADLMVQAFAKSYGVPAIITRSCSNYGPCQHPENFIPSCILSALKDQPIPIYGDGAGTREWIYVLDHCIALIRALFYGKPGEVYNIGTGETVSHLELAKKILKITGKSEELIKRVQDKSSHDIGCSLNSYKIRSNLSWSSKYNLDDGLKETIEWYRASLQQ
jgi:dTDP-glucose 4,6-dehydratase